MSVDHHHYYCFLLNTFFIYNATKKSLSFSTLSPFNDYFTCTTFIFLHSSREIVQALRGCRQNPSLDDLIVQLFRLVRETPIVHRDKTTFVKYSMVVFPFSISRRLDERLESSFQNEHVWETQVWIRAHVIQSV